MSAFQAHMFQSEVSKDLKPKALEPPKFGTKEYNDMKKREHLAKME